jgi:uncharacterized protein YdeI (YjbR/CyaY-like superfamily)
MIKARTWRAASDYSNGENAGAMPPELHKGLPILEFGDAVAWERWLEENHASSDGIWLRFAKRSARRATVSHAEALELALCFGWIDGQVAAYDVQFYLHRFTARRARSKWSQINRQKAMELIERGSMRPAGLAEVQRAKQDGSWDAAYAPQSASEVPEDLRAALDADPEASAFFETLSAVNRYAILYRIHDAKRPQTRARRIAQFVEMLREHRTVH